MLIHGCPGAQLRYVKSWVSNLQYFITNSLLKAEKKNIIYDFQEEKQKVYRREKRKNLKRKAGGDVDDELDEDRSDMAAVMGFSGFGTAVKK